jgi:alginate O-acetyltransferase complex protein AlgI
VRTLLIVLIGWIAFRATGMGQAFDVYAGLLGLNGTTLAPDIAVQITSEALTLLILGIGLAAAEPSLNTLGRQTWFIPLPGPDGALTATRSLLPALTVTVIAALSVMKLAEQSFSPFLYFQF